MTKKLYILSLRAQKLLLYTIFSKQKKPEDNFNFMCMQKHL